MEEEIEYKNYTIKIQYDSDPSNPRTEFDNICTMVCFHSRHNLGDMELINKRHVPISENYSEPIDLLYKLAGINRDDFEEDMHSSDLVVEILNKGHLINALFLYDHSGITISMSPFGCRWDSGQVGYIYMTKEKIKEEWGEGEEAYEKARNCMRGEVETYDDYLTGNVWGYEILDDEENRVDSCSGYYGDEGKKDMIKECENIIDHLLEKKHKKDLLLGIQIELPL